MKKLISFIAFAIVCGSFSNAQNVSIKEDFPIDKMMETFVTKNKSTHQIDGWRIQVMATTDRQKMEDAKGEFLLRYPDIHIDWTHSKPYYRLRAGAFIAKLDAIRLLYKLKEYYPSAYPAKDNNINPQELIDFQ